MEPTHRLLRFRSLRSTFWQTCENQCVKIRKEKAIEPIHRLFWLFCNLIN